MGKKALVILGVVILFVVIVGGVTLSTYNKLITKRLNVDTQWSGGEPNAASRRPDSEYRQHS